MKLSNKSARTCQFLLLFGILLQVIDVCKGHGSLIEPPSRSSAWRFGFKTPINYDDMSLNCGGLKRQTKNGGKCGICGDPWGKLTHDII